MRFIAASASVIGPAHVDDGTSNQDACCAKGMQGGSFAAVADGLGSCCFSHIGSQAAVRLAKALACPSPRALSAAWCSTFNRQYKKFETTCLWGHIDRKGVGKCHQAGDGMVLLRCNGDFFVMTNPKESFANETTTLAQAIDGNASASTDVVLAMPGDGIILMTDGISDDLVTEQLEAFFEAIYQQQRKRSKRRMKQWLHTELEQWATPLHGDDKTIACVFRLD